MKLFQLAATWREDMTGETDEGYMLALHRCALDVEQWAREKAEEWEDGTALIDLGVPEDDNDRK